MTLFALQTFRAHACKCQVMLSTVWFPVTSPKRSRAMDEQGGKKSLRRLFI